ncbi:MAG TPA: SpoIIE family protein phosphatase [Kineosporiaceae bacterium]
MQQATSAVEDALRRSGQVGADLLGLDWSGHPLGPPAGWPRALVNAVRIMLTSRFSMWLAWGDELTFLCNDAYRRDTLGTKYPWALGRPAGTVWQEIWADIGPRIERVIHTGEATWDRELRLFLKRSGYVEETYHTFSYSPLMDDDGAVAGMLCVVSEDTERVIGERRMRTLRDLGTDPTVIRDEQQVFAAARVHLEANPQCLPFTLTYLFDAAGDADLACATGIDPGHPGAPTRIRRGDPDPGWPIAAAASGTEVVVEDLAVRFPGLPRGAWPQPPLRAAVVPLSGTGGEAVSGFLVVGLNRYRTYDEEYRGFLRLIAGQLGTGVAAVRAYQAERRRAEVLADLDRARTAFFTNVSHEFRTPLTLLLGPAEDSLVDRADPLPARQRERVELMQRNAQRMLKLVNMLLDVSRLESGRMNARYEPVDLGCSTAELVSMFRPAFEQAGLCLELDLGAGDLAAHVDRELWAKIVLNLLSNALKHTFTGGVTVGLESAGEVVRLTVADTGIGIEPAEQSRLFERFHRVVGARSRTHEGTGIGLALVSELAQLHGGGVTVSSTPGQGTTFTVTVRCGTEHLPEDQVATLPLPRQHAPAGEQAAGFLAEAMRWSPAGETAGEDDGTGAARLPEQAGSRRQDPDAARVLVVDDNADMRDYLAGLLSRFHVVDTAADGLSALEQVQRRRPDLVLTDIMMPRLDGFGLLATLRGDRDTADIPVIVLSARAGDEATVEGLDAGADDYLVKPFSARELLARVRANLELDRSRRNASALERSRTLLDEAQRLAAVGSWEIDLGSGLSTASGEVARQLGVTLEQLRQSGFWPVFEQVVHPDDTQAARNAFAEAATGCPMDLQVRFVRPDGRVRVHRLIGALTRDAFGRPSLLRGSSQDITEQLRTVELREATAAAREAAAREHEIAEQLQLSLLPERGFSPDHLRVATYYRPGVEGIHIGGDWYDVIPLGAGRVGLAIGDVMGRGVGAAAIMAQLRASVRAFARLDLPPADLLELLDAAVRDLGDDQIVTCLYAVHDAGEGTLVYANAGHLPPLLVTPGAGTRRLTRAAGPPLGTGPFTLTEETVQLVGEARLVLYTDGLVERRGVDIDRGIDALAMAVAASYGPGFSVEQLVAGLLPDGPDDDVAILLAECGGRASVSSVFSWRVDDGPAGIGRARRSARAILDAWNLPQTRHEEVTLVISELLTNALLHGRPPTELRLSRHQDGVLVQVHDAAPFLPRKLRPTVDDEHGRGLQLVSHLAQRWGTRPTRHGKAVWCEVSLS